MAVLPACCLVYLLYSGCPNLLPADPHVLVLHGDVAGQPAKGLEVVDKFLSPTGQGAVRFHAGQYWLARVALLVILW
jgi:hypothetical protein